MKCFRCSYDWLTRIEQPKACPRCKTRLDFPYKRVDVRKMLKEVEG